MTKETDPPRRKSVTLPESLWFEVMEFRHGERISTEAEALRRLVQEGLRAEAKLANARIGLEATMAPNETTDDRAERMEEALERIARWADAYPLSVFPKPDDAYLQKAHEALTVAGLSLDRLSADAMRHVVEGVGKIAREGLK